MSNNFNTNAKESISKNYQGFSKTRINCNTIKQELYNCIEKNNLGFNPELLKFSTKSSFKHISKLKINEKILKDCNSDKLARCLQVKYRMEELDDKKLYEYYDQKYKDLIREEGNVNSNSMNSNINNNSKY